MIFIKEYCLENQTVEIQADGILEFRFHLNIKESS